MTTNYAVQIVKYDTSKREYILDKQVLDQILLRDDVKDCNISVVSISGAIRKGKSFLLSFLLRYLNEAYTNNNESDWLGDDSTDLSGFSWRGGSERHTTGIWIWSKIFTKSLPSGEKVGVMLMDTQGIFDSKTTMKENITIFALSTMISSIQIYNLFNNIHQDDLENLQLFSEYGKLAREKTNKRPFQQILFLVRDWSFPYELQYGLEGGRELLNIVLNESEHNGNEEILKIRQHIQSYFEKIDCFLMPYPGKIVTHSENFRGQLQDIEEDFKKHLKELAKFLLSANNLQLKKINGEKIQAKNLSCYFEIYLNIFKDDKLPNAQTVLNATISANLLSSRNASVEHYNNSMKRVTSPDLGILEFNFLLQQHQKFLRESLEMFQKSAILGDPSRRQSEYENLNRYLLNRLVYYQSQNEAKRNNDLYNRQNTLNAEISNFQNIYNAQHGSVTALTNQITELRQINDAEILHLTNQVNSLRN